jgi:hypothetical protein
LERMHPAAVEPLPAFITGPGQTDYLFIATIVLLIGIVLTIGNLYLRLHALPERMAHRANRVQMEIVAVLAIISLFTHEHLFWIAALLLAFVQFPDFSTPVASIAASLQKLASRDDRLGMEQVEDRQPGESQAEVSEVVRRDALPEVERSSEEPKVVPHAKPGPAKPPTQA